MYQIVSDGTDAEPNTEPIKDSYSCVKVRRQKDK
jgi:hypothetical protein